MTARRLLAASLAAAALSWGAPEAGFAQTPRRPAAASAAEEATGQPKRVTRLGTRDAFFGPLRSTADVRKMGTSATVQRNISTVMDRVGLTGLTSEVIRTLSAPDGQGLQEVQISPGTRLQWMAFREGRRPTLLRPVEWAGRQPFDAYQFRIEQGGTTYTFVLPKACGNLALLSSEAVQAPPDDSAQRAREAEERARAERERAEQERLAKERAERERLEAERRAAEEAERQRQEAERLERERLEAERRARERIDWFVAGFFGKERREREVEVASVGGGFTSVEFGECSPLLGLKGGLDVRLSDTWRMAPAVGVAFNLDDADLSSVFAEVEFNRVFERGFVGTGIGVWDFNHSDDVAATWLIHAGREIFRSANDHRLLLVGEGRLFLNKLDEVDNNYQFWGGLRYVIR